MARKGELTPKQKLFVAKLVANGFNATQAAIDAGYSPKTARFQASELLTNPNIREAKNAAVDEMLKDTAELKAKWVKHMAALAFSDQRKVSRTDADGVHFFDSDKLDDDAAFAIEAVESTVTYGKDGQKIVNRKVKLHSKKGALDTMGKFLGLLQEEQAAGVTIIINGDEAKLG